MSYALKYQSDPLYSLGKDGDVVVSENTTLAKDMYYKNLTVNEGVTLFTNGFRITVMEECRLFGTVCNNGNDANGATKGTGAATQSIGGGSNGASGVIGLLSGINGDSISNDGDGGKGGSGGSAGASSGGNGGTLSDTPGVDGCPCVISCIPGCSTGRTLSGSVIYGGSGGGSGGANLFSTSGGGGHQESLGPGR